MLNLFLISFLEGISYSEDSYCEFTEEELQLKLKGFENTNPKNILKDSLFSGKHDAGFMFEIMFAPYHWVLGFLCDINSLSSYMDLVEAEW